MLEYRNNFKKIIIPRIANASIWWVTGIILLVLFLYYPMLGTYFVSDDYYIWPVVRTVRFIDTYRLFLPKVLGGFNLTDYTEHYIPLSVWLMWFNAVPLRMQPMAAHLVSLCLHLINMLLVGKLGYLITRHKKSAILSSLIFGTFPFITEAVNYIVASLYLLVTFFYLVALIMLFSYLNSKKRTWLVFHVLCFGFGLFSAELAITLPLTVLVTLKMYERISFIEVLSKYKNLFFTYILIISIYMGLRVLSLGTFNIFVSTGHYQLWSMSRMFIFYLVVLIVLVSVRKIALKWISQKIISAENKLWLLFLLIGISWLTTAKLLTQERYLYLSATFASIWAAYLFFMLFTVLRRQKILQSLWVFILVASLSFSSLKVYQNSSTWLKAGDIAYSIVDQVSTILQSHPDLQTPLYLINIPDSLNGAYIHRSFFGAAIEFHSGKKPPPFIFTPLTYGIDTNIQITGPTSMRLVSKNGFSLFLPNYELGKRVIVWPYVYKAIEINRQTLEVEFLDPEFDWQELPIYVFENGTILRLHP